MMKAIITLVAAAALTVATLANAAGYRLAPYKDDLFDYPKVLESGYGGDYVMVEYIEARDINQRDAVPVKQARPEYVSLETKGVERDMSLDLGRTRLQFIATGKIENAKAIVLFVHGLGGDRFLGSDDGMFGGNFNRIKNLMVRNDGLYLSPGFSNLGRRGAEAAKALLQAFVTKSPDAYVFVACGSKGGGICWRLIEDKEVASMLSGVLFMGSNRDNDFFKSPPARGEVRPVPIYIGHGTRDVVFSSKSQIAFFKDIKERLPNYPVRIALFDSGVHGTPIRMTDWRLVLNWMLEASGS